MLTYWLITPNRLALQVLRSVSGRRGGGPHGGIDLNGPPLGLEVSVQHLQETSIPEKMES